MSRVYSAMTGTTTGTSRPASSPIEVPDDGVWENSVEAPFVEVGGPGGPVFSEPPGAKAAKTTAAPNQAEPRPAPSAEPTPPAREFLRLVPAAPAFLSVRFHDVNTRPAQPAGDSPDPGLVTLHFPGHPVSGEYRTLRDEIRKQLTPATSRVLYLAAATPEAGTTTVAVNLAITLASEPKTRVLVVDGNVGRPAVAAKLALRASPGLCEVLSQSVPLAWAVQPSPVPNLQVLAAGHPTDTTPAAIGRDLSRLIGQLRGWYDWVVIDAGVWGDLPERDATCPAADAVYLVTREQDRERAEFLSLRGGVKATGGLLRGYITTRT